MKVLVTGASGLVGQATVDALLDAGHEVLAASRNPGAHHWVPGVQELRYTPGKPFRAGLDAIINLAGASIGGKRWSKKYKQELVNSRLQVTRDAVAANPGVLVQASAIGYYGINPEGPCDESRAPGNDFLANLTRRWEEEANQHTGRTVVFRFGHVLAGKDGILGRLIPLYKARLGGRIGSGKQGLPWVHIQDVARALVWAMETESASGAYNLAAPGAVTQGELNRELATALGVAAPWWIPGPAMRVAVGGLGPYLVGGQSTPCKRLTNAGFEFSHGALDEALSDLFPSQTV